MSYKENSDMEKMHSKTNPAIKPEPQEYRITSPLRPSNSWKQEADKDDVPTGIKPEPTESKSALGISQPLIVAKKPDVELEREAEAVLAQEPAGPVPEVPKPKVYRVYESVDDIPYTPEIALNEGLGMVKTIKSSLNTLELGSKLRKDVWLREIESLQGQGAPTTMIAVCGATGAGKSSILNAVLDDNIVPTSGMRACTAVVTEIAYHSKKTVDAEVSFLSEQEWRDELAVLLDDLVDEEGRPKRTNDLKSDAGVAWHKVHAVYPTILQEQLVGMTVEQILAKDPKVARILGTTKHISAKDSKAFAHEIAKYIDSKDQKRDDKKSKKSKDKSKKEEKEKPKDVSLFSILTKDNGKKKDKEDNDAALWPLIRQVRVKCNSKALSTGAILVDLPGVADANAARSGIAKDYMKKCDCIWILSQITRAVDDKAAKDLLGDAFRTQLMMDGNYDANSITFIASKCDDISCTEIIRALNLDEDVELEEIEDKIQACASEMKEYVKKKGAADKACKAIEEQLRTARAYRQEYKDHLTALEMGEHFEPRLTATNKKAATNKNKGKKRKNTRGGRGGSPKKRKSSVAPDEDENMSDGIDSDFIVSDSDSSSDSDSDSDSSDASKSDSESGSGSDSDSSKDGDEAEGDVVTEESLKAKIEQAEEAIKAGRVTLSESRKEKKEANDAISNMKKKQAKLQQEKNAFCSLKRSEFSRDVLKVDFRQGLKDLDDAEAEKRDPDNFDPSVDVRDYEAIDLPVFCVSARDYVRLTKQVKGDGDPTCFTNTRDTGVPALQQWCHSLTISSRERAARNFLAHLKTFTTSVKSYVEGIGEVTEADRAKLREKWESAPQDEYALHFSAGYDSEDFDPPAYNLLYRMDPEPSGRAEPRRGEEVGITPRLTKEFGKIVDDCVEELKTWFKDGLEEKCQAGAAMAAQGAVSTSDNFAASMHWATYRATLRRHGMFRQDLNVELINPMTRHVASGWNRVFEADLFASFERSAVADIEKLMKDVEESAAIGLKDRVRSQAELSFDEARVTLKKLVEVVNETMNSEQKEVSRCLAPHIKDQLIDGYDLAMEERGKGSVARQKAVFHDFVKDIKDDLFTDGADTIMERLSKAAEAVGKALQAALEDLAEKVEVGLAVLWEGARDSPDQLKAREEMTKTIQEITSQVQLWIEAEKAKRTSSFAVGAE